jgi:hypothetical protein
LRCRCNSLKTTYCIAPPCGALTPGGRFKLLRQGRSVIAFRLNKSRYIPVSWMKSVPFGLGKLDHNWQTHHYRATEGQSLVNQINCPELHIADSRSIKIRTRAEDEKENTTDPLERLDNLSVTIRASRTVFSPSLSSKKYPRSRAVRRAAS